MVQTPDTYEVKTTCAYCGVGCGIVAQVEGGEITSVRGDESHPANYGRLCSKGMSLHETLGEENRLLFPKIDGKRASWDKALDSIADKFSSVIAEHGPEAVAFYVSGQCLTEDYYVANKLMKGYIGAANIDTNSRLCMSSSVVGHKRAFGSDTVPGCYEDLELADLVILVGSNMAWCHPVLYQRILAAKDKRPEMKLVVIDPRETASCDMADLHLPIKSGSDVALFQGLFKALQDAGCVDTDFVESHTKNFADSVDFSDVYTLDRVCAETGLGAQVLQSFYDLVIDNPKTVSVYSQGVNQAVDGADKVSAIINTHLLTGRIGKPGCGPFSVTGQPNAMGGREVGGLAGQLASHFDLFRPEDRDLVQSFWNAPAMASEGGLRAVDLFEAIHTGKVKAVWIIATNPVVSMPDADRVKAALEKCELVVVSDIYENTDTVKCADIVLPATGWGEKDGTVTNSERCISRQRAIVPPPGEARHDWQAICGVATRMGWGEAFGFETPADIFAEYASLCALDNGGTRDLDLAGLCGLDQEAYDGLAPVQWPIDKNGRSRARLFADGQFFTPDGKARFVVPASKYMKTHTEYPFVMNTGRIRDQWHTMTRTGRAARLFQHMAEPFVDIHPDDARVADIYEADIVEIKSAQGRILVRAQLSARQPRGTIFVPMHWSDAYTAKGRVGALIVPDVDAFSGQPAFKSTRVSVARYQTAWHGFALSAESFKADIGVEYWARARVKNGHQVELAGAETCTDWRQFAQALYGGPCEESVLDVLEYEEAAQQVFRTAYFQNNKLVFALFIDQYPLEISRGWTVEQFEKSHEGMQRYKLLAGRPGGDMPDKGAIICACLGVGVNDICGAIKQGADSLNLVGKSTGAGTNCGSCRSDIQRLLQGTYYAKTG
ncbi:MAG: nitrate reductase [Robiginitomaculum sp.]|nr:MAG: nitrate reductase [Robiginitomaculum sp.]